MRCTKAKNQLRIGHMLNSAETTAAAQIRGTRASLSMVRALGTGDMCQGHPMWDHTGLCLQTEAAEAQAPHSGRNAQLTPHHQLEANTSAETAVIMTMKAADKRFTGKQSRSLAWMRFLNPIHIY